MTSSPKPLAVAEFIPLLALMMSIAALSTDAMLPALRKIGLDFGLSDPNHAQYIITAMFLGFGVGQLISGPISDCIGRKPVIYGGYVIFVLGCILSIVTENYVIMLIGRVLQGLGASAPRIIGVAVVRDIYEGRAMAQIMSLTMSLFMLVPTLAPALGQAVMALSHWRGIFVLFLVLAITAWLWFAVRQPETLPLSARRPLSARSFLAGTKEAFSIRVFFGYTCAAGFMFGPFIGYLSSAQQIFQQTYETGGWFVFYFGLSAISIGLANVVNSRLVMRLGMRHLTWIALIGLAGVSGLTALIAVMSHGVPPFWLFMVWLVCAFFCSGIPLGNVNALAMEPVGHMAGLGAALIGAVSICIALVVGWGIGLAYDGTVVPLITGFAISALLSLLTMLWTERRFLPLFT